MLRVTNIILPIDHTPEDLKQALLQRLRITEDTLQDFSVQRRSVDARKKAHVSFVYSLDVRVANEAAISENEFMHVAVAPVYQYAFQVPTDAVLSSRPIIIGAGPAGLFAALMLAECGARPIILERGKQVDERIADVERFCAGGAFTPDSNIRFGEGGAGTFSDGKLYTLINDVRTQKVFQEFVRAGAPDEIMWSSKPHVGTDRLRDMVKNMRERIISLGGECRFSACVTGLCVANGSIQGVIVNGTERIDADIVVCAPGAGARDTFRMLVDTGVAIEPKAFSIGVRIEHPQSVINEAQYGKYAGHPALGAAEYKLVHHATNGRSVYSFCMCPGGYVVNATGCPDRVVVNGMSEYARDGKNANSAIVVGVMPDDFPSDQPLAGVAFQETIEKKAFELGGANYYAPVQRVVDFLKNKKSTRSGAVKPSYAPDVCYADLRECLPEYVSFAIAEALSSFENKVKGFAMSDAIMTGVETQTSSPIRIIRANDMQSSVRGLYPCGEGAGYAGGIVSAAVDGIRIAETIMTNAVV